MSHVCPAGNPDCPNPRAHAGSGLHIACADRRARLRTGYESEPMDNERRADLGADAIVPVAVETNVSHVESAQTAVTDVLAYIAHFCDRLGLKPRATFESALQSYLGDFEDGPGAQATLDAEESLADLFELA